MLETPRRALQLVLLVATAAVLYVLWPLAAPLFLAAVLASVFWPLQRRLSRALGNRPKVSGGLITLLVIALILGPVVGLLALVVREAIDAAAWVAATAREAQVDELVRRLPGPLADLVRRGVDALSREGASLGNAAAQAGAVGGKAAAVLGKFVSATGSFIFATAMMLIALYFFLAEKEAVLDWIDQVSPLGPGRTRELMREVAAVADAVLRSTILTALVQAVAALIGYFIAGVPQPFFFATLTFFVALVPAIGAAAVCLVAAALMLATGHLGAAIFLAIWAVAVVGLVDNVLKPILIRGGRGIEMHGALVFFSLIGGLAAFGAIGLLVGPLAAALFIASLRIYRRDFVAGAGQPTSDERPKSQSS